MRFKNFSAEPIEYDRTPKRWVFPGDNTSFIQIDEIQFVEPGEVTTDFDPDDPIVQLMLSAHPELRPIMIPSIWERLLKPEL